MATQSRTKAPAKKPEPMKPLHKDGSLVGNLTAEPELRFTPSGLPVATLRVAVNKRVQNDAGEWEDGEPEFYNCTVWRQQGENAAECLHKGDRIVAEGYYTKREYESKETGELVPIVEFTARELGPSMLFRTVEINQPIARRQAAAKRPNQRQQVEAVSDPWEDGDEPPF